MEMVELVVIRSRLNNMLHLLFEKETRALLKRTMWTARCKRGTYSSMYTGTNSLKCLSRRTVRTASYKDTGPSASSTDQTSGCITRNLLHHISLYLTLGIHYEPGSDQYSLIDTLSSYRPKYVRCWKYATPNCRHNYQFSLLSNEFLWIWPTHRSTL